jgi:hypothetical protein
MLENVWSNLEFGVHFYALVVYVTSSGAIIEGPFVPIIYRLNIPSVIEKWNSLPSWVEGM